MPDQNKKERLMPKNPETSSQEFLPETPRPGAVELEKTREAEKERPASGAAEQEEAIVKGGAQPAPAGISAQPPKDEVLQEVEKILEEDLEDIYFHLDPKVQKEFHDKGEETAGKIRVMLGEAKIKVKKILYLIRDWLKIIPGINKFFLEQEAKIKTDKILLLAEDKNEKQK